MRKDKKIERKRDRLLELIKEIRNSGDEPRIIFNTSEVKPNKNGRMSTFSNIEIIYNCVEDLIVTEKGIVHFLFPNPGNYKFIGTFQGVDGPENIHSSNPESKLGNVPNMAFIDWLQKGKVSLMTWEHAHSGFFGVSPNATKPRDENNRPDYIIVDDPIKPANMTEEQAAQFKKDWFEALTDKQKMICPPIDAFIGRIPTVREKELEDEIAELKQNIETLREDKSALSELYLESQIELKKLKDKE